MKLKRTIKKSNTTKLFYDRYLYRVSIHNSLCSFFRDRNFTFAREQLDKLQTLYDSKMPLRMSWGLRQQEVSLEDFIQAKFLLAEFEKWVSKRVGARPRSMPMATWLRRSIPVDCDDLVLLYERAVFGLNAESRRSLDDSIQIVKLRWKEQEKTPGTKDARGVVKF